MKTTTFGYHKKEYLVQVGRWAKRLEAEECVIHKNGAVSLYCKDGIICEDYHPGAKELYKR